MCESVCVNMCEIGYECRVVGVEECGGKNGRMCVQKCEFVRKCVRMTKLCKSLRVRML